MLIVTSLQDLYAKLMVQCLSESLHYASHGENQQNALRLAAVLVKVLIRLRLVLILLFPRLRFVSEQPLGGHLKRGVCDVRRCV